MRIKIIKYSFISVLFFLGCQSNSHETSSILTKDKSTQKVNQEGVFIELAMPYGDSLKLFGICWDKNPIDVIIRNQTNSIIHFYENWNSWGYYNFSFQIKTNDSVYQIKRTKNVWFKNFPSYHSINPNESLVFHFNLIDSTCTEHDEKVIRFKGLDLWYGLPNIEYENAKLTIQYEPPIENWYLINYGFKNLTSFLDSESDSLIKKNDTTFIYSETLISKPINIEIRK